jgi:hypothetical protein
MGAPGYLNANTLYRKTSAGGLGPITGTVLVTDAFIASWLQVGSRTLLE